MYLNYFHNSQSYRQYYNNNPKITTNVYKSIQTNIIYLSYSNFKVHGLGPPTSIKVILIQRIGLKLELYYKILFEYYT